MRKRGALLNQPDVAQNPETLSAKKSQAFFGGAFSPRAVKRRSGTGLAPLSWKNTQRGNHAESVAVPQESGNRNGTTANAGAEVRPLREGNRWMKLAIQWTWRSSFMAADSKTGKEAISRMILGKTAAKQQVQGCPQWVQMFRLTTLKDNTIASSFAVRQ